MIRFIMCFSLSLIVLACSMRHDDYVNHFEDMEIENVIITSNELCGHNKSLLDSLILWSITHEADYRNFDELYIAVDSNISSGSAILLYIYLARDLIMASEPDNDSFIDSILPVTYLSEKRKRLSPLFPGNAEDFFNNFVYHCNSESKIVCLSDRDTVIFNLLSSDKPTFNKLIDSIELSIMQKALLCFAYAIVTHDSSYNTTAARILLDSWDENSKLITAAKILVESSKDSLSFERTLDNVFMQ